MPYPIATGSRSGGAYGVRGIPAAFLLDHEGTVIWSGNPHTKVWVRMIPKALEAAEAARTDWDPGDRHAALARAVKEARAGALGDSWRESGKLFKKYADTPDVLAEVERFQADLLAVGEKRLAKAQADADLGCYFVATEFLAEQVKVFKGSPVEATLKDQLATWKKDADAKKLAAIDKKRMKAIDLARAGEKDKAVKALKSLKKSAEGTLLEELVEANYETARL